MRRDRSPGTRVLLILLVGLGLAALLFLRGRPHFVEIRHPKQSFYERAHEHLETLLMRPRDWKVELSGTVGTPVVVGYEIDRSGEGIFRGVAPTNFTVRVRRRLYYAVKNVGPTNAQISCTVGTPNLDHTVSVAPFYGVGGQIEISPPAPPTRGAITWVSTVSAERFGSVLTPIDWPMTLPPGMSKREAKRHDFIKELHQSRLRDLQAQFTRQPKDAGPLWEVAQEHKALGNNRAAAAAYEALFATDWTTARLAVSPEKAMAINNAVYDYVEIGGTNLDRAYELALKAEEMEPFRGYIKDTVGWILFKRGDYERALDPIELSITRGDASRVTELFHLGMTHYMLMQEDAARRAFRELVQGKEEFQEKEEARKCLEFLDINANKTGSKVVAKLKRRLAEQSDDPVALDRLALLCGQGDIGESDPLVLKALGCQAYRRKDFSRAAQYLAASAKYRRQDGDLFFYLGMSRRQLNQNNECADALRNAIALQIKPARVEEANRVLASISTN